MMDVYPGLGLNVAAHLRGASVARIKLKSGGNVNSLLPRYYHRYARGTVNQATHSPANCRQEAGKKEDLLRGPPDAR
jgi:hypothetical protein